MALEVEHICMDLNDDFHDGVAICSIVLLAYNYSKNQAREWFCSCYWYLKLRRRLVSSQGIMTPTEDVFYLPIYLV